MYSTDYDYVVPLAEDSRVCEETRGNSSGSSSGSSSSSNSGSSGAKIERSNTFSDRVVGKKQFIHGDAQRRQHGGIHRGQTAVELMGEQSLRGNRQ